MRMDWYDRVFHGYTFPVPQDQNYSRARSNPYPPINVEPTPVLNPIFPLEIRIRLPDEYAADMDTCYSTPIGGLPVESSVVR